jgi:hypothetical protein
LSRSRRQATTRAVRDSARDVPKTLELEQRLSRVELQVKDVLRQLSKLVDKFDYVASKIRY